MSEKWFSVYDINEAAAHVADVGYGEDMHGNTLEIVPLRWNNETGILVFDDGRDEIMVEFQADGSVKFISKR